MCLLAARQAACALARDSITIAKLPGQVAAWRHCTCRTRSLVPTARSRADKRCIASATGADPSSWSSSTGASKPRRRHRLGPLNGVQRHCARARRRQRHLHLVQPPHTLPTASVPPQPTCALQVRAPRTWQTASLPPQSPFAAQQQAPHAPLARHWPGVHRPTPTELRQELPLHGQAPGGAPACAARPRRPRSRRTGAAESSATPPTSNTLSEIGTDVR
jgi:hypothetical protein